MDMFQHFLSHQSENTSAFSDIFRPAKEFHRLLGQKSYLLNHYLSMFFRLIVEMDFCALEDEIYQSISDLQKKIRNDLENHDNSIPIFDCQEPATEMELCWTALADSLLEQALKEFYHEYYSDNTDEYLIIYSSKESFIDDYRRIKDKFPKTYISLELISGDFVLLTEEKYLKEYGETDIDKRLFLDGFIRD